MFSEILQLCRSWQTYAPYAQDAWHVRPNVTLNLGLRYEYESTPENTLPIPCRGIPDWALVWVGPPTSLGIPESHRFPIRRTLRRGAGLAYTPQLWKRIFGQDKTVFRLGYGIFYDQFFTNILDNTATSSPNAVDAFANAGGGRGIPNASTVFANFSSAPSPFGAVTTIASNLRNPLTQQWNVDIQRELPGNFILTAAYVGTRGERLFVNQDFDPGTNQVDANGNLIRLNPNSGPLPRGPTPAIRSTTPTTDIGP